MALGLNFGTGAAGDGDSLLTAFTSINNMFSTTTKISGGDLTINDVRVGRGAGNIVGNTAVGASVLTSNTSGTANTAIGNGSAVANQGGASNTSLGSDSLFTNISGNNNTAIGKGALQNSTSNNNTAIGQNAGSSVTNQSNVTCLGYNAQATVSNQVVIGDTNVTTTILRGAVTADKDATFNGVKVGVGSGNIGTNTVVGNLGLNANSSGYQNVAVGNQSLVSNVNGYYNTGIGVVSLSNNVGFANCTGVGFDSQITADGQVQLGNASTTPYAYQALSLRSDERDKTEVRDTVLGLDFINELRAVDYKWDMREDYKTEMPTQGELSDEDFKILMDEWLESVKLDNLTHDGTNTRTRYHHGLIAQEVQDVIEASGVDFGGFQDHSVNGGQDVLSIGYTELIAPMIKAIQELTARINVLEGN